MTDQRKKLVLLLPMLHQGGFERVAVATARLLAEDYRVTICIFSDKNIQYDVSGLDVVNLDVPSAPGKLRKALNVGKRILRLRRLLRKRQIDLCYSFGNTANLVNLYAGVGSCRNILGIRCGTDLENRFLMRRIQRSDLVLSCSRELQYLLERDHGCRRTACLYNPLDVEGITRQAKEHTAGKEPGSFVIVTMGRDDVIKAHWHMIKAFALVAKAHPEARLKIIGAGKYTRYQKLAADLGIEKQVCFTGNQKNPFPEVAAADLYVLPSNREGFPNALVEAMALGLPVIATDCRSGPREILLSDGEREELLKKAPYGTSTDHTIDGRYGILIPDMNDTVNTDASVTEDGERCLAGQILRMIEDRDLREAYAAKSRERTGSYEPQCYRQNLKEILEGTL